MRPPLSCIVAGQTTTFPQRSSRCRAIVNKTETELIPVFCKCRLPDDGGVMIPCSQVPQVMYQTTRQVHEQSTLPVLCQCKCQYCKQLGLSPAIISWTLHASVYLQYYFMTSTLHASFVLVKFLCSGSMNMSMGTRPACTTKFLGCCNISQEIWLIC